MSNAAVRHTVIFHKSPLAADAAVYTPFRHKSSQSVPRAAVIPIIITIIIYYIMIIETIPTDGRLVAL